MGGLREEVVSKMERGSGPMGPNYKGMKDTRTGGSVSKTGVSPSLLQRIRSWLFGNVSKSWTAADEARDVEARRRVAEHDRQFYENRK